MTSKSYSNLESNYRILYGKLFSALINQFGIKHVNEIEDAIQNSFLKSLKKWKTTTPKNEENWLFIVAKNDVINQIKKDNRAKAEFVQTNEDQIETSYYDLRLQTILFLAASKNISSQAKVIFTLKNIFGLHIREIAENILLSQDAIYKSIQRTKKGLQLEYEKQEVDIIFEEVTQMEISIVEEILYAVFNIGFDSFNEKIKSIVNEDLCLEALSLTKLLLKNHQNCSTRNLLALFCFHIARIQSKVDNGKLISFFEQDRQNWSKELITLGFNYLQKPEKPDRFYIESLIVSHYMSTNIYNIDFWNRIINLYELLIKLSNSPIIKLNYCYCLHKGKRSKEALDLLETIKLPSEHIYFSLVKANILKHMNTKESKNIMSSVLNQVNQPIRKEYLLANGFIGIGENQYEKY